MRALAGDAFPSSQRRARSASPIGRSLKSGCAELSEAQTGWREARARQGEASIEDRRDRKSTRLNSSHLVISYAVFCLKKKIVSVVLLVGKEKIPVHRYRFPPQETDLKPKDRIDDRTEQIGSIESIDRAAGTVDIKKPK